VRDEGAHTGELLRRAPRLFNFSSSPGFFTFSNSVASASEKPKFLQASRVQPEASHAQPARLRKVNPTVTEHKRDFDAAIFDMDGVLTRTAGVHSMAWKRMFDEYLQARASRHHERFKEFMHAPDYLAYVDGRPRYKGVEAFLKSRGIDLPLGSPEDRPGHETICGLGNRKDAIFTEILERDGVHLYASTIALIQELRKQGIQVGLATSSRNSAVVLNKTRTAHLFATVVDGVVSETLGLKGKPDPDIFTTACTNLGVPFARAIVIEDAVSGVQAGARGGFGLVIGIARENNSRELRDNGADLVVPDLAETSLQEINRLVRAKRAGA
jgi:beta-phosphoglucomutase family hydrolase